MQYHHVSYEALKKFCIKVFQGYKFNEKQAEQITDVLLAADLSGIESHGVLLLFLIDRGSCFLLNIRFQTQNFYFLL